MKTSACGKRSHIDRKTRSAPRRSSRKSWTSATRAPLAAAAGTSANPTEALPPGSPIDAPATWRPRSGPPAAGARADPGRVLGRHELQSRGRGAAARTALSAAPCRRSRSAERPARRLSTTRSAKVISCSRSSRDAARGPRRSAMTARRCAASRRTALHRRPSVTTGPCGAARGRPATTRSPHRRPRPGAPARGPRRRGRSARRTARAGAAWRSGHRGSTPTAQATGRGVSVRQGWTRRRTGPGRTPGGRSVPSAAAGPTGSTCTESWRRPSRRRTSGAQDALRAARPGHLVGQRRQRLIDELDVGVQDQQAVVPTTATPALAAGRSRRSPARGPRRRPPAPGRPRRSRPSTRRRDHDPGAGQVGPDGPQQAAQVRGRVVAHRHEGQARAGAVRRRLDGEGRRGGRTPALACGGEREALLRAPPGLPSRLARGPRLGQRRDQRPRGVGGVAGREQPPAALGQDLRRAPAVRRDDRATGRHRLQQDQAERLAVGAVQEAGGLRERGARLGERAEEAHPPREVGLRPPAAGAPRAGARPPARRHDRREPA